MMLGALVIAICLADGSVLRPDGPALAVYVTCEEPLEISGTAEPEPPTPVELGVDCTEPFTVSLPDDVLTECE